ncbi:MAG TPA: hypothetical protein VFE57_02950 [Cyclobacteriaceae bacterium]|nr:hypothetical protein [Cyclobacteriaceae bacterium]
MLRKGLCFVVLVAMIAHCASRLGVVSFLYQKRHAIAYSMGVIAEVPIAMCTSDYDFGKGPNIETSSSEAAAPITILAQEINLFFVAQLEMQKPQSQLLSNDFSDSSIDHYRLNSLTQIFRPPLV